MQTGGIKLDFSGIAKGHAVDRVSEALTRLGATSHLVEIGGELKGRGVKPDAQPWWVEIERVEGSTAPRTVAALYDLAMATSGDYRRAFEHNGRLYPHTLDGSTGRPVSNALASVTVLHASAMKADAYATALTVMGPFEGPDYAEAVGLAAHFVERTERGLVERMTPAFAAMMDDPAVEGPG
jgi:thiamine biosynthesis lipoprotein